VSGVWFIWFIWFVWSVSFGWFDERERQDRPALDRPPLNRSPPHTIPTTQQASFDARTLRACQTISPIWRKRKGQQCSNKNSSGAEGKKRDRRLFFFSAVHCASPQQHSSSLSRVRPSPAVQPRALGSVRFLGASSWPCMTTVEFGRNIFSLLALGGGGVEYRTVGDIMVNWPPERYRGFHSMIPTSPGRECA